MNQCSFGYALKRLNTVKYIVFYCSDVCMFFLLIRALFKCYVTLFSGKTSMTRVSYNFDRSI